MSKIPLTESLNLLEETSSKMSSIRDVSGYLAAAARRIAASADTSSWTSAPPKAAPSAATLKSSAPSVYGGGRTAKRAAELGMELSEDCIDAMSKIPLTESLNLLEE